MAWVGRPIGSVQDQNIVFDTWPGVGKMHELALAYPSDVAFSPPSRRLGCRLLAGWLGALGRSARRHEPSAEIRQTEWRLVPALLGRNVTA
jgi:hypothetical protein